MEDKKQDILVRAVVLKEDDWFIAIEPITNVASQGRTIDEAINNLKEALELYLEEKNDELEYLRNTKFIGTMYIKLELNKTN